MRHKPEAEPALKAMQLLGAEPEATVMIGDSVYDLQCGHAAGIATVFVTWSRTSLAALPLRPTYCINAMDELLTNNSAG